MRYLAIIVLAACGSEDVTTGDMSDATKYYFDGAWEAYGPCDADWGIQRQPRCHPKCTSYLALGKQIWGYNTCIFGPEMSGPQRTCPMDKMTGQATVDPTAGCCIPESGRIEFYPCR
jgi:hypothetical protein